MATAISAVVGTLLIGLLSNLPLAQASGMGLNAYFVYTVCVGLGLSYANALVLVLFDGIIFVLLTVTGLRKIIFDSIPHEVKVAISAGIGLFIAFIGLQNAGIVVNDASTCVNLHSFNVFTGEQTWATIFPMLITLIAVFAIGAMSKKKAKDVAKEREAFLHGDPARNIKGCVANGIDPAAAEKIYDEIFAFANYAFNKAHAVSYAVVAYQTAYFKCHFTREYMAALLTSVLDNSDKVSGYIGECRECGIALLPPDINRSADRFTVEEGGIRFGLVAIKNIGRGFIQAVMRERETGGPFTSLYDFCSRMNGSEMNKRAVENLIRSGAFDSMGARRSQLIKVYESVMDSVAAQQRENVEGQMDFFSMAADNDEKSNSVKEIPLPDIPEYTPEELMTMEKATTGLYLSGHPMDHYRDAVRKLHAPTIVSIIEDFSRENGPERFTDGQRITIAGVITSSKTKTTKNNSLMAYVMVEDDTASMELLCFSRVLETCGAYMKENQAVVVKGRLSVRDEKAPQIMCDSIYPLSTVEGGIPEPQPKQETAAGETLFLKFPSIDDPAIRHMKLVFQMFPGKSVVKMVMADTRKVYATQALLHPALVQEAQETLGHENVVVK